MKKGLIFISTCCALNSVCLAGEVKKPNFILIMADDMGYGDVGFNGNEIIHTPCLDSMARDGVIMNRFYSAAPVSSPTRASVLTGRHPFRTGVFSANVGILRKSETTLPEVLKQNGYRTGIFGKWHLGTLTYTEKDANRGDPKNKHLYNPPEWHGFDVSFITESKVPTYDPMKQPVENDGRFWDYLKDGDKYIPYGTSYWNTNGDKVTEGLDGDDSRIIIDKAMSFIKESSEKGQPFLCVIWLHAPHLPCVSTPEAVKLYQNLDIENRNYYGCITALDKQIGRLRDFLEDLGIMNQSTLFFCSDNGPELNTPGSNGKFKGRKRSLHEGGIRVPAFIYSKSHMKAGSKVDVPCSTMDYFPTILDMAGISDKKLESAFDGESLLPVLSGKATARQKPIVLCSGSQGAVIEQDYKLYYSSGSYELYEISEDPYEKKDISNSHPKKAENMKVLLVDRVADYKTSFQQNIAGDEYSWQKWWDIWKKSNN